MVYIIIFFIFFNNIAIFKTYTKIHTTNVNIVGFLKFANGLGRVTTTWIDILSKDINVKFIDTRPNFTDLKDIDINVKNIIQQNKNNLNGNISILTDCIWSPYIEPTKAIPNSKIKIAYTMCESTKAPAPWIKIINEQFDAIVVPDEFLIDVYKTSGVIKPIFVLPLAMYLDGFLKLPLKQTRNTCFTFGISAALSKNKNIELLIESFNLEFNNAPNVLLKIHTPWDYHKEEIEKKIKQLSATNIELSAGELSWTQYINFIKSLDCYVLLSKGEGFSMTPREAMALGIPTILSNNSAHKTICNSNLAYSVSSNIKQLSEAEFYQVDVGYNFNCNINDVRNSLKEIYLNYQKYLEQASARREWTRQYLHKNLKQFYLNLVRPKKLILGTKNEITKEYLMTSDNSLFKKYKEIYEIY